MAFVRAKTAFRYRSARINPGDVIEVPEKDVRLLVAVGRAEEAEKPRGRGRPPKPKAEQVDTKVVDREVFAKPADEPEPEQKAEPKAEREPAPKDIAAADEAEKPASSRGRYARRDLTAED